MQIRFFFERLEQDRERLAPIIRAEIVEARPTLSFLPESLATIRAVRGPLYTGS